MLFRLLVSWNASLMVAFTGELDRHLLDLPHNESIEKPVSEMSKKFQVPSRFTELSKKKNLWAEFEELVVEHPLLVNLGRGYPDSHPPPHLVQSLAETLTDPNPFLHQTTRSFGHPRLVKNLAKLYSPLINRELDPFNEILVTIGAYEAIHSTIQGHINPGDEVIIIEPFFDCYANMVKVAGGIPKYIPLRPKVTNNDPTSSDWVLDEQELSSLFSDRTKMIIVNSPNNPVGKVFKLEELELIAQLCKKYDVMCLSDEVYEWLIYKPNKHVRMASLPGMWERTITLGSASKAYSVTGWKTGWAYGPANLIKNLQIVHTASVYSCHTPTQEAIARALEIDLGRRESPDCYLTSLPRELRDKRDYLVNVLKETGFKPVVPDGGYFVLADWTALEDKLDLSTELDDCKGFRFAKKFFKTTGVLVIPPSGFYSQNNKRLGANYARFCFVKKQENLELAAKLIEEWILKKQSLKNGVL